MSSSTDDELVSSQVSKTPRAPKLAPTTRHSKLGNANSSLKPKVRRGPITKTPAIGRGSKDDPMDVDHSDGKVEEIEPPLTKRKSQPSAASGGRVGKGRGKAGSHSDSQTVKYSALRAETTNVHEDDVEGINDEAAGLAAHEMAAAINNAAGSNKLANPRLTHENVTIAKLQKQLAEAEARNAALSKQLDEVLAVRNTEAEQLLQENIQVWEARLATQEKTIQELTSNLARVEPLSRSGKGSVLHLLTRDAADEEKRVLEKELAQLKETVAEKDRIIVEKDKQIQEYAQQEKELRFEIKMLKEASSRTPAAKVTRNQHSGDPKLTELISFYEDITDLAVLNIQCQGQSKYLHKDEWLLVCLYTLDSLSGGKSAYDNPSSSLNFSLRSRWDLRPDATEPITSEDQLKKTLHYTPLHLDQENLDFVNRLDFLKAPFTFEHSQLTVFLRTLRDTMLVAISGQEIEDGDDSQTAIEVRD